MAQLPERALMQNIRATDTHRITPYHVPSGGQESKCQVGCSVHVIRLVLANCFIFSARHQLDTSTLAPRRHVIDYY